MRIYLILIQLFIIGGHSQAQSDFFNKAHDVEEEINGYEDLFIVNKDTSIISGFFLNSNSNRYRTYTLITNQNGDTIRSFMYGRDTMDIYGGNAANIYVDSGFIYSCGALYDGQAYANFLKFDRNGDLFLDTLYNPTNFYSRFDCMLPTDDGNFLILGCKEVSFGNLDAWLVKMDPSGNIIWEQTYGGPGVDPVYSISKNIDNSYILAMFFDRDGAAKSQIWIKKIDLFGITIWDKIFGGEDYDGAGASILSDTSILIYGLLSTPLNLNAHPFVMKLDQNGNEIWRYFHPNFPYIESEQNCYNGLVENSDQTISMYGWKYDGANFRTIGFLQKLSKNGESIWYRELSSRNNENYLTDLKLLNNGDLLMIGYVFPDSPNNTEDGWIMRTNCLGYFEHPKDSIVLSGSGENVLSLTNYSSYYDYTIVNWGDNSSDTVYASGNQNIMHEYTLPGNYSINTTTIACNDTIHKNSEYLVFPEQFESSDLVIFPNPNQGHFEIWLDSPDLYSLEIMDLNGRIVKSALNVKMNQGYIIDLSELGSSIYLVRAFSGNKSFHKRVVTIDY